MKNNKGFVHCIILAPIATATGAALVAKISGLIILSAMAWHVPAWDQAKESHSEKDYQSQEMFPQQLFDKLPGGQSGRSVGFLADEPTVTTGGYWEGRVLAGK